MPCSTSTARPLCCDYWARDVLHGLRREHGHGICGVQSEAIESKHMTPAEVKAARQVLAMTQTDLAQALRMGKDGKRAIRRWEVGDVPVSGPASVAIEALLTGWRP